MIWLEYIFNVQNFILLEFKMQLFVQAEQLHCIDVKETDLLISLKKVVQSREGININEQV